MTRVPCQASLSDSVHKQEDFSMTLLVDILINVVLLRSLVEPCKVVLTLAVYSCASLLSFHPLPALHSNASFFCHQINQQ